MAIAPRRTTDNPLDAAGRLALPPEPVRITALLLPAKLSRYGLLCFQHAEAMTAAAGDSVGTHRHNWCRMPIEQDGTEPWRYTLLGNGLVHSTDNLRRATQDSAKGRRYSCTHDRHSLLIAHTPTPCPAFSTGGRLNSPPGPVLSIPHRVGYNIAAQSDSLVTLIPRRPHSRTSPSFPLPPHDASRRDIGRRPGL